MVQRQFIKTLSKSNGVNQNNSKYSNQKKTLRGTFRKTPKNWTIKYFNQKPYTSRLSYNKWRSFASDKTKLKQPVLPRESVRDLEKNSEPELDIQYKDMEVSGERSH